MVQKIIFLDIDGVLNSMPDKNIRRNWNFDEETYNIKLFGLDPDLVKNLKLILDRTNAKIVFSTSWRYFKDHHIVGDDWRKTLSEMLEISQDIFLGDTPKLSFNGTWDLSYKKRRGLEIKSWLENHTEPGKFKFCIIDDEIVDITPVFPETYIVHTDWKFGLQMKDVDRAVRILNGD